MEAMMDEEKVAKGLCPDCGDETGVPGSLCPSCNQAIVLALGEVETVGTAEPTKEPEVYDQDLLDKVEAGSEDGGEAADERVESLDALQEKELADAEGDEESY
jgi:hypothetical protein